MWVYGSQNDAITVLDFARKEVLGRYTPQVGTTTTVTTSGVIYMRPRRGGYPPSEWKRPLTDCAPCLDMDQGLRDQQLEYERVYQTFRQLMGTTDQDLPANGPERYLRTGVGQTKVGSVQSLYFFDEVLLLPLINFSA